MHAHARSVVGMVDCMRRGLVFLNKRAVLYWEGSLFSVEGVLLIVDEPRLH